MDISLAIPECGVARFVEQHEDHLIIPVRLDAAGGRCPECGQASRSVHRRYHRQPADLPVSASQTRLRIEVRRFYCLDPTCRRRTFAETPTIPLQLEWKTGDSREFNLRNEVIDFDSLDEVNSTDGSATRVEMLTPAQVHFATSLAGIDFRPEMPTARLDDATGHLAYAVGPTGRANLSAEPGASMSGRRVRIGLGSARRGRA